MSNAFYFDPEELERTIRRVVREELTRLLGSGPPTILDDWNQEGPEDLEGDAELLLKALAILREHEDQVEAWMHWEDFEAELEMADAGRELPD